MGKRNTEATEITLEEALVVIQELKEVNAELTEQLENANLQKAPAAKIISFEGEKYNVQPGKFRLGATIFSSEELEANPEAIKELLAIDGQSILTKI